jgi:acyl-CoA hydrolase
LGPADVRCIGLRLMKIYPLPNYLLGLIRARFKWIDQAGYACAVGWSGQYCVTVYVGGIRFYRPVLIGHLVEVRARIIYTGTTSMHLAVDVSSRDPKAPAAAATTHCVIVFVAVDQAGEPTPVPAWAPITDEDIELERYARKLMELRKGIEAEVAHYRGEIGD